jgi:hypothetical protein
MATPKSKKLPYPVANPPKAKLPVMKLGGKTPVANPPRRPLPVLKLKGKFPVAQPPHAVVHRPASENTPYPV